MVKFNFRPKDCFSKGFSAGLVSSSALKFSSATDRVSSATIHEKSDNTESRPMLNEGEPEPLPPYKAFMHSVLLPKRPRARTLSNKPCTVGSPRFCLRADKKSAILPLTFFAISSSTCTQQNCRDIFL